MIRHKNYQEAFYLYWITQSVMITKSDLYNHCARQCSAISLPTFIGTSFRTLSEFTGLQCPGRILISLRYRFWLLNTLNGNFCNWNITQKALRLMADKLSTERSNWRDEGKDACRIVISITEGCSNYFIEGDIDNPIIACLGFLEFSGGWLRLGDVPEPFALHSVTKYDQDFSYCCFRRFINSSFG